MKNRKNLNLVLIGLVISLFGSAVQRFSFSLYLLDLTNNAAIFSNVLAISVLPFVLFAPLSGMIADRYNKKKVMVLLDSLSAGVIFVYLNLFWGNPFGFGIDGKVMVTAIVMFLLSSISAFYTPAVTAIIPFIVEEQELIKANAKISQVGSIANLAGPMLAGILYGLGGIMGVTVFNGISFLGSAILEMFIIYNHSSIGIGKKQNKKYNIFITSIKEMLQSYRYLKKEKRVVLKFINSYFLFNLCIVPVLTILMPFVLRSRLGVSSVQYGVIEGLIAAGMIVGAFAVSIKPEWFPVHKIYRWDYLLIAATVGMLLAGRATAIVWTICGFIIMSALGIGNVVTLSHTQQIIDAGHLGKVSAYSTAVATISVPLGQMVFGWYLNYSANVIMLLSVVLVCNLAIIWYLKCAVS